VSLARRRSLMLAGFSPTARVGVDLEIADTGTNIDPVRLAVDHLSTGEAARIAAAPPPEARDLFLRLWVAKEAVLKLTGRGVYDGMHKPDLALALDRLRQDGAEVELPSPDEQGALRLAVCRLAGPGSSACYGSLAVVSHSL
jgi:4'-phosphopantetheinyl transferase